MITINGKSYKGNNLSIVDGKVIVDGVEIDNEDKKTINIKVEGNIESIQADNCSKIEILGNSGNIESKNGDVKVGGNVSGSIATKNGNISCSHVGGDATTKNGSIFYKGENLEKMLDWLVELNIQHYKTEKFPDYTPTGNSHFYLNRSAERFTSAEMIQIFQNKADKKLLERWNDSIADTMRDF